MRSRNPKNYKGIDISMWQKGINLSPLKSQGYSVCIVKATEGATYQDPEFGKNYDKAVAQGMKVGIYHYWRGTSTPEAQAQNIVRTLNARKLDCKIAIDVETTDGKSKDFIMKSVLKLASEIKRLTGNDPCIYTYTSFAKSYLDSRLAKYSLWIAEYGRNDGKIQTPSANGIWSDWAGFQYTDKGKSSVNNSLDLNEFTDEIFLGSASKPTPSPTPNKETFFGIPVDEIWKHCISGDLVLQLQRELNRQFNAGLKEDGYFGWATLKACITVRQGAKGNITKIIQKRLLQRGYTSLNSSGGADGSFGAGTTKAVINLQNNKGLDPDGVVGVKTWFKLMEKMD